MRAVAGTQRDLGWTQAERAAEASRALLDWYDRERRDLPWRAKPGRRADPYPVWLSEVMLQQTTVKAVIPYYAAFLRRWPTLAALAAARLDEVLSAWAGLGYYSRARNLHACARAVVESHDAVPLRGDPAEAAGDRPLHRRRHRGHRVRRARDPGGRQCRARGGAPVRAAAAPAEGQARAEAPGGDLDTGEARRRPRPGHDGPGRHRLHPEAAVLPRVSPRGLLRGPRQWDCRAAPHARGQAGAPNAAGPGLRRDPRGRLRAAAPPPGERPAGRHAGGALDRVGGSATRIEDRFRSVPVRGDWHLVPGIVSHTFTHFRLGALVYRALVPARSASTACADAPRCQWLHRRELDGAALPSVMRKLIAHALRDA